MHRDDWVRKVNTNKVDRFRWSKVRKKKWLIMKDASCMFCASVNDVVSASDVSELAS